MKDKINDVWARKNQAKNDELRSELREKMVQLLREYAWENYPNMDDKEDLICAIKRDFESDLIPTVLADSLNVEVGLVRRFRHTRNRGVIDTSVGSRRSIPTSKRKEILERDGYSCVRCPRHADNYALQLHHIIPKSHGGIDEDSNFAMLCEPCHLDAHCGDFSKGKIAYEDKDEFWEDFAGK